MEKEMIEHLHYLKDKGLFDIGFHEDQIKSARTVHVGQVNERIQNIDITPLKCNSKTLMYHGTTLEKAKKIIVAGFIEGMQDKDDIDYNKTFMTKRLISARRFSHEGSNYDSVILIIDLTKYKVYTFSTEINTPGGKEWIIWDKINLKDVKFNYYKDNVCVGELTSDEIMKLPKAQLPRTDIFTEVINLTNKYLFDVDPYGIHGIYHSKRVIMILRQLERFEILSDSQKTILAYAGLYHDIGRTNNGIESDHGFNSYKKIIKFGLLDGVNLNTEEHEILRFIIQFHCLEDESGYKAIQGYNIKDIEMAKLLYDLLKDADALDRVRFGGFDKTYLRKNYSQFGEKYAIALFELDGAERTLKNTLDKGLKKIGAWDNDLLKHLIYLKDKDLFNIEFTEESITANRLVYDGGSFTQKDKNDEGYMQKLDIRPLKNPPKIMFHGTTLENAKGIITDGFIQMSKNTGTERSNNKDVIEYNKVFITDLAFSSRNYGLRRCNNYDDVLISIDITKYQVYSFFDMQYEFFIWDKVDIKDVKFSYYKDNELIGEFTPEEIMELPILEEIPTSNVFLEALSNNNMYLFFHTDPFGIHGVQHSNRLIMILQKLNYYELLSSSSRKILAYAGLYHEVGRNDKEDNILYGIDSYKHIVNTGLIENAEGLNIEEHEILKFIIQCHPLCDEVGYKAIQKYDIKDVKRAKLLYDMFKDAEELDKLGVLVDDIPVEDLQKLRRPYSFIVIDFAQQLYTTDNILELIC